MKLIELNISTNGLDERMQRTLCNTVDGISWGQVVSMVESRIAIQMDFKLCKLEEWATRTFRKFTRLGLFSMEKEQKTEEKCNGCLQQSVRNCREDRGRLFLKVAVKGQEATDPNYNNRHTSWM